MITTKYGFIIIKQLDFQKSIIILYLILLITQYIL